MPPVSPPQRRSSEALPATSRALLGALLLVVTATAHPVANDPHGSMPPDPRLPEERCLAELDPDGLTFSPLELRQASVLYRAANRSVELDNRTLVLALALAKVLDPPPRVADLVNFSEERIEICVFSASVLADREDALLARALDRSLPEDTHVGDLRLVTAWRTTTEQRVALDREVALAVLALQGPSGALRLDDVIDLHRTTRTERTFERVVAVSELDVVVELILRDVQAPSGTMA